MKANQQNGEPVSVSALLAWLRALPGDYPLGVRARQRIGLVDHYCLAQGVPPPQESGVAPVWVQACEALVEAQRGADERALPLPPRVALTLLEGLLLLGNLYGFEVKPRDALDARQESCPHKDIEITLYEGNRAGVYTFRGGRIAEAQGNDERTLYPEFDAVCPACSLDRTFESVEDAPPSVRGRHQQALARLKSADDEDEDE